MIVAGLSEAKGQVQLFGSISNCISINVSTDKSILMSVIVLFEIICIVYLFDFILIHILYQFIGLFYLEIQPIYRFTDIFPDI